MWSPFSTQRRTTDDATAQVPRATLLLVDDEPNITRSLQRVLRREPYRLLTAHDAQEALTHMAAEPVDLVISDVRMPGMDGVTLLARIQEHWPDCLRILLTGYAELSSTIKAINEGSIYRYVSKPWDDDELRQTIAQSLGHREAELERRRLLQLTREQNEALATVNASLEQRVRERTAELEQTARLLDQAHGELKRAYVVATEVFSSLLQQRLPVNRQSNRDVIAVVDAYAQAHELPRKEREDLAMAAALYNIGKLTWTDELIVLSPDRMQREQRQRYRDYPEQGQHLLMALEPAQDAALIIRHHQERWDGNGFPDGIAGSDIPFGARLLKLAVDFVELQMGMVLQRKLRPDAVLQALPGYAGRLYDPELIEPFSAVARAHAEAAEALEPGVVRVGCHQLVPGMTMARKLYSASGMLLLSEGKTLSQHLVERLQAFEANENAHYELYVREPDPDDDGLD